MQGITIALKLLSGVALFLFGMSLMGDGLKRVAGNSLERTLYRLTNTPIKGVLLGALVTAVIQSSSATTVMVVGFVNSGMMQVAQAIGVIMGANIGTSITGWILCLSYIDGASGIASLLSTATISAVVAVVGIIMKQFMKKSLYHNIGDIMLGFAILMTGMQTMSSAVSPLKDSPTFVNLLTMFKNPILGILVGIAFTAVLQSASASVGILQALSMTGAITFASAYPIILGIGIGAACPVLLSAIGTNNNGKRTALVYLVNDCLGMIIWGSIFYLVNAFVHFDFLETIMSPVAIAALNSIYRILTICVLLPFIKLIEKLVFTLIRDSEEDLEEQADFDLLEERFLAYPGLAISQVQKAMNGMLDNTRKNVYRSMNILFDYSEETAKKIEKKEDLIDKYEDKLGTYLMRLTKREMNTSQTEQVSKFLHTISDIERLGDHACNLSKIALRINSDNISFSYEARAELDVVMPAMKELIQLTAEAFWNEDRDRAAQIEPLVEVIKRLCDKLKSNHVERLQEGHCEFGQGFVFNDIINNFERMAAHCSNIGLALIEVGSKEVDSHEYLHSVMTTSDTYAEMVKAYKNKYNLKSIKATADTSVITAEVSDAE